MIDEVRVREAVEAHGLDWRYFDQTESTNTDALEHHAQHQRELVAFAEAQNAGRGRRGRQWLSPHGRNIYCTIGLVKSLPAAQRGLLSILTGLALCRAMQRCCEVKPDLKWPNDLLVDGHKLGGILIESRPYDAETYFYAIGFGLNVFLDNASIESIGQPVVSLHQVASRAPDRSEVLTAAIDEVVTSIRDFDVEAVPELLETFHQFDAFHNSPVELVTAKHRHQGINRGIDASGALQLETERGIESHPAAEISLVAR